MRRLRLFWLMVLSFVLVILLALCGMLGLIGLTFAGTVPSTSFRDGLSESADGYAIVLRDYYVANGDSWAGVERRLDGPPFNSPESFYSYTLLDPRGDLLASSNPQIAIDGREPGMPMMRNATARVPLLVRGESVGVLVVQPNFGPRLDNGRTTTRSAPSFLWSIWRGFAIGGLVFGGMLMMVAIVFARRLTRPLRGLTAASEALAAGRLDTRVPGASVRELDELASAFNRMAERLSASDTQRRQMTADIAHELRTPLSIIRGRLEGLQDGVYQASPDQIAGLLGETALLERLVEDLRLLALAEAGQLRLYREPTDPRDLAEDVVRTFADQAARQEIQLSLEIAPDLPEIEVDPQRISQVLANLLSNALRHTPAGGQVVVGVQVALPRGGADRPAVAFTVRDSGAGISAEDLPHIFDRFWRADRSRTRESGGSGLGLAIVRQLTEAHGGYVTVSSAYGAGSTFSVHLPVQALGEDQGGGA
jgi:signal transduction histidine kinase